MILITDNFAIDADERNFILKSKRTVKDGKRKGCVDWVADGFYPTIGSLIQGLNERQVLTAVRELKTIQEAQEELRVWADSLQSPLISNIKEAISQYEVVSVGQPAQMQPGNSAETR